MLHYWIKLWRNFYLIMENNYKNVKVDKNKIKYL